MKNFRPIPNDRTECPSAKSLATNYGARYSKAPCASITFMSHLNIGPTKRLP